MRTHCTRSQHIDTSPNWVTSEWLLTVRFTLSINSRSEVNCMIQQDLIDFPMPERFWREKSKPGVGMSLGKNPMGFA